jgi:hypothetical protein
MLLVKINFIIIINLISKLIIIKQMSAELPPTEYFSGINFNPDFYTSGSDNITTEEAKNLIVAYNTSSTDTITTLTTTNINAIGSALNIGPNLTSGSALIIGSDTNSQTSIKGSAIGLLGNSTVSGFLTTTGATTSNTYNISGIPPTLTKLSLGYYVNYAKISASFATANKYIYSPSVNTSTGESHYLNAGVYFASIHMYTIAPAGQTYSSTFSLGVATGTNIQTMPVNSQYGTFNIESSDLIATNTGSNITGNYFMYSHSGCFTLTSSSFANIEFHLNAQSGATLTFNLYGCIYRIG